MNIRNNSIKMISEIYKQAKYYEIAFDFIDVKKQVQIILFY